MRKLLRVVAVLLAAAVSVALPTAPAAADDGAPVEAAAVPVALPPLPIEVWWWIDALGEFLIVLGGPDAIERTIRDAAAEFGVDPNLMVAIARCESRLTPWAQNRSSGAAGLFQHIPRYYPPRATAVGYHGSQVDPLRPRQNARAAAWLLATAGTSPWRASARCW
jgi:soluble lytic murein transglycosylase-like protein